MEIRKTSRTIRREKLNAIYDRFKEKGWFVVNSEYYTFGLKL